MTLAETTPDIAFPEPAGPPAAELAERVRRLQDRLRKQAADGALIVQNADLYYFAGTIQQGNLYVPAEGAPVFMARKSLARARHESALENIVEMKSPRQLPDLIRDAGLPQPGRLGLELDVLPAQLYLAFQKIFQGVELVDAAHDIRTVRSIKSGWEMARMREAAACSDKLLAEVGGLIREGMSELELAGLVEAEARRLGHQGLVRMRLFGGELFYGHLMAGPGAALPSFLASPTGGAGAGQAMAQGASQAPLRAGEPILVDYTFCKNGYISDCTRIFAIGGLPGWLMDGHEAMRLAQAAILEAAKVGVSTGELYAVAVDKAGALGYADNFMGAAGPERIRFVGHGVGLELDEYPFIAQGQKTALAPGMTIALEPKLIFPGYGVVGIENTFEMTAGGLVPLTRFPEEVVVV